jgi:hypothetical protein
MDQRPLHTDREAGVTFPIPFEDYTTKTANQVTNLIADDVKGQIPEGAAFTSGVYSGDGVPFVLVWKRADKVPPNRSDVDSLEKMMVFDRAQLRGVMREPLPAKNGLKALILTQIAKGETIQVGYYYKSQPDAALFKTVTEGFTLAEDKRLSPEDLPSGPSTTIFLVLGLIAFAIGCGAVLISRRVFLKRSGYASPGRGNA